MQDNAALSMIALNYGARATMQRDMELMRSIIREIQSRQDLKPRRVEIEGYEDWIVQRHAEILYESGLLDATVSRPISMGPIILVRDLTGAGHDFAAAMNNDNIWSKMKQRLSAAELATVPIAIIKEVGQKLLTSYLMQKVGLGDQ